VPRSQRPPRKAAPQAAPASAEAAQLRELSARCRGGRPPPRENVEEALSQGFARLVMLEAELVRARRRGATAAEATDRLGVQALVKELEELRHALEQLRSQTSSPAPLAHGFVFPARRKR